MQEIHPKSLMKKDENTEVSQPREASEARKQVDEFADHVLEDVIYTPLKDLAVKSVVGIMSATGDFLKDVLTKVLWPDGRAATPKSGDKVSYAGYWRSGNSSTTSGTSTTITGKSTAWPWTEIEFESSAVAQAYINDLKNVIDYYKKLHVSDLYDIGNKTTDDWTAERYGWTSIEGITTVYSRETHKYMVVFPTAPIELK